MENRFMRRALLALTLICTLTGCFAASRYFRKAAIYIAAPSVEAMQSPQEIAAVNLFLDKFGSEGVVLTPADVDQIDKANFDMLWIPIDSTNVSHSTETMRQAFTNPIFYDKVRKFHADGGNLYLTMFAIQLLTTDSPGDGGGLGLIPDYLGPNIIAADLAKQNTHSVWGINAEIGSNDKSVHYYDRRNHPIYANLERMGSNQWTYREEGTTEEYYKGLDWGAYDVFPMQGRRSREGMDRYDHNCMWQLAPKTGQAKVGVYVGYEMVHNRAEFDAYNNEGREPVMSAQERLQIEYALRLQERYNNDETSDTHIEIICPGDVERLKDVNNFDVVWVHIDRCNYPKNDANKIILPDVFTNGTFINYLTNFVRKGGDLYLTKHANLLLPMIGRIPYEFAPNMEGDGGTFPGGDNWEINALIGWNNHANENSWQFYDHTGHPIYQGLTTGERDGHAVFPLHGTNDDNTLSREDHNCAWDLNAYSYTFDGANTVEKFQNQTHSTVLGTWGHVTDYAVATIIEFPPTGNHRGYILSNGSPAYQWATDGKNVFQDNLENFTYNCLRYLVTKRDIQYRNNGGCWTEKFEQDANAVVLGTWGQDADHSAAGIVEFKPANRAGTPARLGEIDTDPALTDMNRNKAAGGTILVNGMACTTTAPQYHNDYQANSDLLHTNSIDYLAPWHSEIVSGVEDVAVKDGGMVRVVGGELRWSGFEAPAEITLYGADGRVLRTLTVEGTGSCAIEARGLVIVSTPAGVVKAVI